MRGRANERFCVTGLSPVRFAACRFALLPILVVSILAALATTAYALSFGDVRANHPYVTAISDLASRGVISGLPDGTFQPDTPVTRQQFAKMIVKTLGFPVSPTDTDPFTDVPSDPNSADPFYPDKYVAVCYEKGLTEAKTPTTFAPFGNLSRAQLITFVARAANLPDPPAAYSPPFSNFSPDHYSWARKAAYANLLDGLQGMGPSFDFFQSASRGECAQVLQNLLLLTPPKNAGTTLSPSAPTPGLRQDQTLGGSLPAGGAASLGSLLGAERILQSPYAITGICVVVLVALAGVLFVVRRARSARWQSPYPTRLASLSTTQEDVQAILRQWAEKKAVPPLPQELGNRTTSADDALPLAKASADARLWNELIESAQKALVFDNLRVDH